MLCALCLIVLWGFSLVTSYSGVNKRYIFVYTRIGSNKGKTPEHKQAKHTKHPHSLERHNSTITIVFPSTLRNTLIYSRCLPQQFNAIAKPWRTVCRLASADELCCAPRIGDPVDPTPDAAVMDALDSLPVVDSAAALRQDSFVDLLDIFEVCFSAQRLLCWLCGGGDQPGIHIDRKLDECLGQFVWQIMRHLQAVSASAKTLCLKCDAQL